MTRIKICGLRTAEDIDAANQYCPDYVGFVFAPSKRQITPKIACMLKQQLNTSIQTVGVFVNEDILSIARLVSDGMIDLVQLHGDEDDKYRQRLKQHITCPVIQAVSVGKSLPDPLPRFSDFLLFDTASSNQRGGSGTVFDWSLIKGVDQPFFLSGGLKADNVTQAIASLSPYCVDTSSGMETDGKKDPEKIRLFIELARIG